ncbi:MAG: ArsR/SmtB family transcription factor [Lachnospiraceae bacterium]
MKQQCSHQVDYLWEGVQLLRDLAGKEDQEAIRNSLLSCPTLNTAENRALFSLLTQIESEARKEFQNEKEDLDFYFSSDKIHSNECVADLITLWDEYWETYPDAATLFQATATLSTEEYNHRFSHRINCYLGKISDGYENDISNDPADICRSILALDISDPEKVHLQQVFLDPAPHREKVQLLLTRAQKLLMGYEKEIARALLSFQSYWDSYLENHSFLEYLTDNELMQLDENPLGITLQPALIFPHAFSLGANTSKDGQFTTPYLAKLGILFHDEFRIDTRIPGEKDTGMDDYALRVLKLLSDKSKYDILNFIKDKPAYGAQLAKEFGLTTATISHHMSALVEAGLVRMERENGRIYYYGRTEEIQKVLEHCMKSLT